MSKAFRLSFIGQPVCLYVVVTKWSLKARLYVNLFLGFGKWQLYKSQINRLDRMFHTYSSLSTGRAASSQVSH